MSTTQVRAAPAVNLTATAETTTLALSQIPVHYVHVTDFGAPVGEEAGDLERFEAAVADRTRWIISSEGRTIPDAISRVLVSRGNNIAFLFLERGSLRGGQQIEIRFRRPDGVDAVATVTLKTAPPPKSTFTIEPKQAPDERLIDGSTKYLLQFGIRWDVPSLYPDTGGALVYFRGNNLLSSDPRDVAGQIQVVLGAKRSLSSSWYVPGSLELTYQTNQASTQSSLIIEAAATSILPWGWTSPFLWNDVIRSPVSPELSLGVRYEWRLSQDPLLSQSHASTNLLALKGQVDWRPIHLLSGSGWSPNDITLEIKAQWWYFPNETATAAAQAHQWESSVDLSLYIPMSGLPESFTQTTKGRITRVRIQYTSGANAASGYVSSQGMKLSLEMTQ